MFLNLKNNQLTITTYRKPSHYACDIDEMLQAIENQSNGSLTCYVTKSDLKNPIIINQLNY